MKICYLIERRKFNERNMFNQSFRKKTVLCVMKEVDCIISRVMMKGCTSFGFVDKWSVSYLVAYYTLAQIYGIFMNEKKPKQLKGKKVNTHLRTKHFFQSSDDILQHPPYFAKDEHRFFNTNHQYKNGRSSERIAFVAWFV